MRSSAILAWALAVTALCATACGSYAERGGADGDWLGDPDADPNGFMFHEWPSIEEVDWLGAPGQFPWLRGADEDSLYGLGLSPPEAERIDAVRAMLADDMTAAGYTPCVRARCYTETVALLDPSYLRVDLTRPTAFPNGRRLEDPALDVVLAAIVLDITAPGDCNGAPCSRMTLADIPLNPRQNDMPFQADFPFLAPPHPAP